jgi:hypothetical protein
MKYSATTSSAGNYNNSRFGNMTRAKKVTHSNSVVNLLPNFFIMGIFSALDLHTYHTLVRHNQRPALAVDRVTIAFVATGQAIPRRMGDSIL